MSKDDRAAEIARLKERERRFAALMGVPDGGRYQNDWESRAEAIAGRERVLRLLADALVDATGLLMRAAKDEDVTLDELKETLAKSASALRMVQPMAQEDRA